MTCKCKILKSWPIRARGPISTGRSSHVLWKTWESMIARCNRASSNHRKNWGGRGIGVCETWVKDFHSFANDMGTRPKGRTLDRIDVKLGYCPHNCRWATALQQGRNRRGYVSQGLPRGVHLCRDGRKKKYIVQFSINGKRVLVGYFLTIKEANNASIQFRYKQKFAMERAK